MQAKSQPLRFLIWLHIPCGWISLMEPGHETLSWGSRHTEAEEADCSSDNRRDLEVKDPTPPHGLLENFNKKTEERTECLGYAEVQARCRLCWEAISSGNLMGSRLEAKRCPLAVFIQVLHHCTCYPVQHAGLR